MVPVTHFQTQNVKLDGSTDVSEEYNNLIRELDLQSTRDVHEVELDRSASEHPGTQNRVDPIRKLIESEFERSTDKYEARLESLRADAEESTKRFFESQGNRIVRASNEYQQMYSLPYGSRDKRRYFSTLVDWFRFANAGEVRQVEDCFEAVADYSDDLDRSQLRYMRDIRDIISRYDAEKAKTLGYYYGEAEVRDRLNSMQVFWIEPVAILMSIGSRCRSWSSYRVPGQPVVGASSLGVIGRASEWLLRTGSVPFTTVMGMLGFGLLGATFSTFIRERRVGPPGSAALVEDLAGAVIRGMSAALVVFLGVYGGLAIIAGAAEPNPYMLFFLCLVGAVFSERVWEWARKKLGEQLTATGGADVRDGGERDGKKKAEDST